MKSRGRVHKQSLVEWTLWAWWKHSQCKNLHMSENAYYEELIQTSRSRSTRFMASFLISDFRKLFKYKENLHLYDTILLHDQHHRTMFRPIRDLCKRTVRPARKIYLSNGRKFHAHCQNAKLKEKRSNLNLILCLQGDRTCTCTSCLSLPLCDQSSGTFRLG